MYGTEAHAILMELQDRGIDVTAEGGSIIVRPTERMTDDLRRRIKANKPMLLTILHREPCPPPSRYAREFAAMLNNIPDSERRAALRARFEGRAAVFTFGRGLPWDEADRLAMESLRAEVEGAGRNTPP